MSEMYDVVIVGGGIAGGALAAVLARGGVAVAALERDPVPIDRVRGVALAVDHKVLRRKCRKAFHWSLSGRGIADGQKVRVFNDRGSTMLPVKVTRRIAQVVVSIKEEAWFTPGVDGVDTVGVLTCCQPIARRRAARHPRYSHR